MSKINILIVDDEPEILENLSFDLMKNVGEIYMANNGAEALQVFEEHKDMINAIITDIKMPRMNGLVFIEKLRRKAPNIPVIFLTAHGDEEQMQLALSLNAFDFINKPYDLWELQEIIASIQTEVDGKLSDTLRIA